LFWFLLLFAIETSCQTLLHQTVWFLHLGHMHFITCHNLHMLQSLGANWECLKWAIFFGVVEP
jgi:hypothetical protein